ncbi:hypothetical protein M23134_00999 [Microscilla marina ATCC 23134]|uniref:Uncharacterized protein n=1 Tax=Microscilla marina ATCC 23134 TaxID=313606 RepID=A1ZZH9_MICM2|nr:hypothetical protein M23134_00999 [Microscilla marina ATCC 23134]
MITHVRLKFLLGKVYKAERKRNDYLFAGWLCCRVMQKYKIKSLPTIYQTSDCKVLLYICKIIFC